MSWSAHFWTIAPHLRRAFEPWRPTNTETLSWSIPDERYGAVTIRGQLDCPEAMPVHGVPHDAPPHLGPSPHDAPPHLGPPPHDAPAHLGPPPHGAPPQAPKADLLVVVHGLGGSSESGYVLAASRAASQAGLHCLRLNLRGADERGDDFYHAGLFRDVDHVLRDPRLDRFASLYLLGYSLGGHVCLRWAASPAATTSRVRALATVCAPLDLGRSAATFDAPALSVYRSYVLASLKRTYEAVAARHEVPLPVPKARRVRSIREWDDRIVAPRHGFAGADHYYREASAAGHLNGIGLPTLMVVSEQDPMVPLATLEQALTFASPSTVVRRLARAGHVGFPARTDLGQAGPPGLEPQLLAWFQSNAPPR